jgi:hypothetical protein
VHDLLLRGFVRGEQMAKFFPSCRLTPAGIVNDLGEDCIDPLVLADEEVDDVARGFRCGHCRERGAERFVGTLPVPAAMPSTRYVSAFENCSGVVWAAS